MSQPTCLCCSSYNAVIRWCNYHSEEREPDSTCSKVDESGSYGGNDEKVCRNCPSFDPDYQYGWCDYRKCRTSSEGYCKSFG